MVYAELFSMDHQQIKDSLELTLKARQKPGISIAYENLITFYPGFYPGKF
jgi:hypothetical protein